MPAGFEYIEVDVDGITAREAMRKIESCIAEHDVRKGGHAQDPGRSQLREDIRDRLGGYKEDPQG